MLPFKVFTKKLAHILSFSTVVHNFRITIVIDLEPAINVHVNVVIIIVFKKFSWGLYYYDTTNMKHNTINNQVTYYTFMITVESNNTYFHQHEIK